MIAPTDTTVGGSLLDVTPCSENTRTFTQEYLSTLVEEQVGLIGVRVTYKRYLVNCSKFDSLFGEQPQGKFENEKIINAIVQFNDDSLTLGRFGFETNNDVNMYIPFDEWTGKYGNNTQPFAGDIFRLTDLFCEDKSGRDSPWFELTTQDSGNLIDNINNLRGIYWNIFAKRFDYSFQPNVVPEGGANSKQLGDSTFFGILSAGTNDECEEQASEEPSQNLLGEKPSTVDEDARAEFDEHIEDECDDVYGGY